jgi:hypothetical protein
MDGIKSSDKSHLFMQPQEAAFVNVLSCSKIETDI